MEYIQYLFDHHIGFLIGALLILTILSIALLVAKILLWKGKKRLSKIAEELVDIIIQEIEQERGWRCSDTTPFEFVSIVLGSMHTGEHRIWVRVKFFQDHPQITVEYLCDADQLEIEHADTVAQHFRTRNFPAAVKLVSAQPTEEEIFRLSTEKGARN